MRVVRVTYRARMALLWPPARHTMSAMARARQCVLWALEGCSRLKLRRGEQ